MSTHLQQQFEYFKKIVPARTGYHWILSMNNPGDGRRWCIAEVNDESGGWGRSLPRNGMLCTRDFNHFMQGVITCSDLVDTFRIP